MIDLTLDDSPPQSTHALPVVKQSTPKPPNSIHHFTSDNPSLAYRNQARSPTMTSSRSSSSFSNRPTPTLTSGSVGNSRGPSMTPHILPKDQGLDGNQSLSHPPSKAPNIPLTNGIADIRALVKQMRRMGQFNAPGPPSYLDAIASDTALPSPRSSSLNTFNEIVTKQEQDTTHNLLMSPSGSVAPVQLEAIPDWMSEWRKKEDTERKKLEVLWAKYARVRKRRYEQRAQTTARRKPTAKRLGPKGRAAREQEGLQFFFVKDWIAEMKAKRDAE